MTIRTTIHTCKRLLAVGALGSTMALAGCDIGTQGESGPNLFYPTFNLLELEGGSTPQPLNFAFLGAEDGTLQIGTSGDPAADGLIDQLNALDGWSTTAPITIPFAGRVDESSLAGNIHVLNVVLTSANNAELLQMLLARAEEVTIDILSEPVGHLGNNTDPADFFLDPDAGAFDPAGPFGLDYAETAQIFGLLKAAEEIYLPALQTRGNAPLTGHIVPVQVCDEVTELFEPAVAQANPNNVLLKPRTALRSGDDPTCANQTQIGLLSLLFNEIGQEPLSVDIGAIADDPNLPVVEVDDIEDLLAQLEGLFEGNLTALGDYTSFPGTGFNGANDDGNAEFSMSFSNGYLPVVTRGVKSTRGQNAGRDGFFETVMREQPEGNPDLDQLKQLYFAVNTEVLQGEVNYLEQWGITLDDVVLSFPFSTQSTTTALDWIADTATSHNIGDIGQLDLSLMDMFLTGEDNPVAPLVFGNFKVFVGLMEDVPYYLNNKPANIGNRVDGPTSQADSQSIAFGSWTAGGEPVTRYNLISNDGLDAGDTVDIPVVIATPDPDDCGGVPANGWPVSLHGHGNGRTRADVITIAGRLAEACIASVAIDDVLHGTFPSQTFFPLGQEAGNAVADELEQLPPPLNQLADEFRGGDLSFQLLELLVNPDSTNDVFNEVQDDIDAGVVAEDDFIDEVYARIVDHPDFVSLVTDSERHFFLDLEGDGQFTGNTGQLFFMHPDPIRLIGADGLGLGAALTTRDQHRQSIADKIHLVRSLADLEITDSEGNVHTFDAELRFGDDGDGNFTTRNVFWNGISQGGITGSTLVGVLGNEMRAYVPNVPTAGFLKFIEGSIAYAGELLPGLQDAGIVPGSEMAEQFFTFGQQIVDPADPLNYAITAPTQEATVLYQYVVGDVDDCFTFQPDRTVPNSVINDECYNFQFQNANLGDQQVSETAPHAGSTPHWMTMGLTEVNAPIGVFTEVEESRAVVRYARGNHSSLLDFGAAPEQDAFQPGVSAAVTREMQSQVTAFFTSTMAGTPTVSMNIHSTDAGETDNAWDTILVREAPIDVPDIFLDD